MPLQHIIGEHILLYALCFDHIIETRLAQCYYINMRARKSLQRYLLLAILLPWIVVNLKLLKFSFEMVHLWRTLERWNLSLWLPLISLPITAHIRHMRDIAEQGLPGLFLLNNTNESKSLLPDFFLKCCEILQQRGVILANSNHNYGMNEKQCRFSYNVTATSQNRC